MDGSFAVSSLFGPPPTNTRKRNHDRISDLSTRQSPCSIHEAEASSFNNTRSFGLDNIRMPAIHRFRGDGLDMRRPIMSTQPAQDAPVQDVIDLTEEPPSPVLSRHHNHVHPLNRRNPSHPRAQRGPRYEREIIDTEAEMEWPIPAVDIREGSPEVEFISERPRSQSASGHSNRRAQNHGSRPAAVIRPHPVDSGERVHGRATIGLPGLAQAMRHFLPSFASGGYRARDELVQIDDWQLAGGFEVPDMNFGLQGFNLDQPSRPVQQPRLPTYDAPPAPRAGFTRELQEEDELVCPNCDDELGVGDEDMKRQVWIVKACGHVYCGECAKNRSASSKNAIPSSKSKPFKKCVVEDCGKSVSKNSMIQIYL